jgi:hypothetical protein
MKLFSVRAIPPVELTSKSIALEKFLRNLNAAHLDTFLRMRFLATGTPRKVHGGRIDTSGGVRDEH